MATYIDDFVGVQSSHFIGVDKLMWSFDYPHQASTWPHSQEVVRLGHAGVHDYPATSW